MAQYVGLKDAVRIAIEFVGDLFKDAGLTDLRLEEVQQIHEDDWSTWEVTVSFLRTSTNVAVAQALGRDVDREYKTVVINSESGQVLALRIRELAQ